METKINRIIFSKRLKELLAQNNETINTLAQIVHLSPATISRYQSGLMTPKMTTVESMATHFQVNAQWLAGARSATRFLTEEQMVLLTSHERRVITAYQNQPEMQNAVDRLLGVEKKDYLCARAAHMIEGASAEDIEFDNEIMEDENF